MDDALAFDWNEANKEHIARHRVSPEEAEQVLHNDPFDVEYETLGGEERFVSTGHTNLLRVLRVVWILRGDAVRVITAHDVSAKERRAYFRAKGIAQ